ncbi:hypothetical protein [Streptomyces sp. NPDC054940]
MSDTGNAPTESHRRPSVEAVHKWSATIAGLIALAFSIYNFIELKREPEIDATAPHAISIGQPSKKNTLLYIQPTVATRFKTQDVEVIRDARLRITPTGSISSSKKPDFYWFETGEWAYDIASDGISFRRTSDPAPFIVSQDKPQQPTLLFAAVGWIFQPGRYEISLELHRSSNHEPLTMNSCLTISKKAASVLHRGGVRGTYQFRDDQPGYGSGKNSSACYEWFAPLG